MVQPTERGEQPSPRCLPHRIPAHRGTMQHVSGDVLQELQQQRESEEEKAAGSSGATRGRGAPGARRPAETNSASFTFTPADSTHSKASSPPPLVSEATRYARSSRSEVSRGRYRGSSEAHTTSQSSFPIAAVVGLAVRSRTPTPSPRSRSAETLSPQLLGGSTGSNADILIKDSSSDVNIAVDPAITPRASPSPEHAHLSPCWLSRCVCIWYAHGPSLILRCSLELELQSKSAAPQDAASAKTPSNRSSQSISTPSFSSGESSASSFAYLLRDNRADKRLFQKKSLPLEHRSKHAAAVKRPTSIRSASFYRPKVVEESALPTQPIEAAPSVPNPTKVPPTPLSSSSFRTVIREGRASQSLSQSDSSRETPLSPPPIDVRQGRPRPAPLQVKLPPRPAGFGMHSESQPKSDDSTQNSYAGLSPQHLSTFSSPRLGANQRSRRPTPPEADPRTPFDRTPSHGDHYFRIFGPDTIYEKMPSNDPTLSQPASARIQPNAEAAEAVSPFRKPVTETTAPAKRSHLRDSIFQLFHVTPKHDNAARDASDSIRSAISPAQSLKDVKNGTPLPTKSSRKSIGTPDILGSYFPMHSIHKRHNKSSENSSGTLQTPIFSLATN